MLVDRSRPTRPERLPESDSLWQILAHMRFFQSTYYRFRADSDFPTSTWSSKTTKPLPWMA